MANWGYTLEDKNETVLPYLDSFQGMTLTMPLNGAASMTGTISHNSADMTALYSQIATGAVFIRAARDGVTRFWGVLNDLQVSLDDSGTASLGFVDVAGLHSTVMNYTASGNHWTPWYKKNPTWTAAIDSLLSKGSPLVSLTRSGSPSGRVPSNDTLANASGHAKLKGNVWKPQSSSVLESLQELAGFADGIEWYVTPKATLTVGKTLGSDKSTSVFLQYGPNTLANAQNATISYQPPANNLFFTNSKGVIKRTTGTYNAASVAAYGDYSNTFNFMARRNQSDEDRAAAMLRTKWKQVVDVTIDPASQYQPWVDYFLGDTVSVRVTRDSLNTTTNQRINRITVTTDDQGLETSHQLEFEVL